MPKTELIGPYDLSIEVIDEVVLRSSPGTYVLGYVKENNTFIVEYVGRSDSSLKLRLKSWVGKDYQSFKFRHFDTAKDAFHRECRIYHDFGESELLDNKNHPQRPENTNWDCPACDIFTKYVIGS